MNRLFLQCGVSVFMGLFAVCRTMADAYTEYYWTGAADYGQATTNFNTAGNWALADGTAATAKPDKTKMLIFTNDAPIVMTPNASGVIDAYGLRFYGKSVDASNGNESATPGKGGNLRVYDGGVVANGGGDYKVGFNLGLTSDSTKTVTVDVAENSTFYCVSQFAVAGACKCVKSGKGTFDITRYRYSKPEYPNSELIFEDGTMYLSGNDSATHDYKHNITLRGPESKAWTIYAVQTSGIAYPGFSMSGGHFSADAEAETAPFYLKFGRNKTQNLNFNFDGDQTDTRFNATLQTYSDSKPTGFLNWMPNDKTRTLTYVRANLNNANWYVAATNGIVTFADGVQITSLKGVIARQDGKVVFDCATAGAELSGAPWIVRGNGTFSVKGRKLFKVSGVTVDGTAVAAGYYTKETATWLADDNEATIIVGTPAEPETVAATWVGGSEGNSIFADANWQGGTAPDLANFATVATFPADATVVVPENTVAKLKGFATQGAFTVSGAGTLWTGSEGLTTGGTGALSIGCTVQVAVDQTWNIGSGHATTFTADSQIVTPQGIVWTVNHSGSALHFRATNEQLFEASFVGSDNSVNVYADNALGGKGAEMTFDSAKLCPQVENGGRLTFDADFRWTSISWDKPNIWAYGKNCEVIFNGYVWFNAQNDSRITTDETSCSLRFKGGFKNHRGDNKYNMVRMSQNVRNLRFESTAFTSMMLMLGANTVWFDTTGNRNTRGIVMQYGATVHTTVPDVFMPETSGAMTPGFTFTGSGTWNLHDGDQYVEVLCGSTNATGNAVVTSESDALVKLNARTMHYESRFDAIVPTHAYEYNGQTVDGVSFRGGAGIEKSGPIDHYMMGTSTSTGRVSVVEGRLVFTRAATDDSDVIVVPGSVVADVNVLRKQASWQTASSVSVSGTGTLVLEHDKVFGKKVNVSIDTSAGAKIELPIGAQMRCAELMVDGVLVKGLYSGTGVSGGTIFAGHRGLMVVFR